MIVLAGKVERGKVVLLGSGVNRCTVPQEELHHPPVTLQSCMVQRSMSLGVAGVHQESTASWQLRAKEQITAESDGYQLTHDYM